MAVTDDGKQMERPGATGGIACVGDNGDGTYKHRIGAKTRMRAFELLAKILHLSHSCIYRQHRSSCVRGEAPHRPVTKRDEPVIV